MHRRKLALIFVVTFFTLQISGEVSPLYSQTIEKSTAYSVLRTAQDVIARKQSNEAISSGSINRTPTNQAPTNRTPTNQTPTKQTPTNRTPTNQAPTKQTPTEQTTAKFNVTKTERIIVLFDDEAAIKNVAKYGKILKRFKHIKGFVLEAPERYLGILKRLKGIKKVNKDRIIYALPVQVESFKRFHKKPKLYKTSNIKTSIITTNELLSTPDPNYLRWNLKEEGINAKNAWDAYNVDGEGIKIAVLDSGVNYNLEDLNEIRNEQSNLIGGYLGGFSFADPDGNPIDNGVFDYPEAEGDHSYASWSHGHGTMVTSLTCGQGEVLDTTIIPNRKATGVAYKAGYYALKVIRSGRPGEYSPSPQNPKPGEGLTSWVISAIDWCLDLPPDQRPDVINMSFGGYEYDGTFEGACNQAYNQGIILVAGSGNDSLSYSLNPAAFDNVISVGAHTKTQLVAPYSNGGVDFVAPAGRTTSDPEDWVTFWVVMEEVWRGTGTSFATPHASGMFALQLQYAKNLYAQSQNSMFLNNAYFWEAAKHSCYMLLGDPVMQGSGKADAKKAIELIAQRWPINYALNYSPVVGSELYCKTKVTNILSNAMPNPTYEQIENLTIKATQAYYRENSEAVLPGTTPDKSILENSTLGFPGTPSGTRTIQYSDSIDPNNLPANARTKLEITFNFENDLLNREIKIIDPYAGRWENHFVNFEAEDTAILGHTVTYDDSSAWAGAYISSPLPGAASSRDFTIPEEKDYTIFVRMSQVSEGADSIDIRFNNDPPIQLGNLFGNNSDWEWVDYRDGDKERKVRARLSAGKNTLSVITTEADVKIDSIVITDDFGYSIDTPPEVPSEISYSNWTQVIGDGFASIDPTYGPKNHEAKLGDYNGSLYASTSNTNLHPAIYKSDDGINFTKVFDYPKSMYRTLDFKYLDIGEKSGLYALSDNWSGICYITKVDDAQSISVPMGYYYKYDNGTYVYFNPRGYWSKDMISFNGYAYAGFSNDASLYFTMRRSQNPASYPIKTPENTPVTKDNPLVFPARGGDPKPTFELPWTNVSLASFGKEPLTNKYYGNMSADSSAVFKGYLYVGTYAPTVRYNQTYQRWEGYFGTIATGAQIWRTSDGTTWEPCMINGFGSLWRTSISHMTVFGGYIYATTSEAFGPNYIYRSKDGNQWELAYSGMSSEPYIGDLTSYMGRLYLTTYNWGGRVYSSPDGTSWTAVSNPYINNDSSNSLVGDLHTYLGHLYVNTRNMTSGTNLFRAKVVE